MCERYPNDQFVVVSRKKFKPFFEEYQNLTFFHVDFENRHKGLFGIFRLFKDLKKVKPNKVADLHNVLRTKIISFLMGVILIMERHYLQILKQEE